MLKRLLVCVMLIGLIMPNTPVLAQSEDLPTYTVQAGDTLNIIALRFGVSTIDLIDANQLANPDILAVGTSLKIPGLEGVGGELSTVVTPLGENLIRISLANHIATETLVKLNRITSPNEVYAGSTLIIPQTSQSQSWSEVASLATGQSMLEYSVIQRANPWIAVTASQKHTPSYIIPDDPLFIVTSSPGPRFWGSPLIQDIQILPLPLVQGKTITVRVKTNQPVTVNGDLAGRTLQFFQGENEEYIALQGIHALAEPGLANINLNITSPDGEVFTLAQPLLLELGYYPDDPALFVDPQTLDTTVTKPEDELIQSIVNKINPDKYWDGMFRLPVDEPSCIKSWYGNRRSYNGGPYNYFHTGVDYGVCANFNIYAPASGTVVFAGSLTVRGNATIIDHGQGIFSGIWHQQSISVNVGDQVEAEQFIGEIGGTGRATGPHLHWEVWVNGVQVEPLDWLETEFPLIDGS